MRDDCQGGSIDCGPYGFTTCPDCHGEGCRLKHDSGTHANGQFCTEACFDG